MSAMVLSKHRHDFLRARCPVAIACIVIAGLPIAAQSANEAPQSRGAYLAAAADCASCHTAGPKAQPFAGGLSLNSPFGKIYSSNITPDPVAGIGDYSFEDFSRALRKGIAKDGKRLYPAMPYPSFSGISDEDMHALYDYFMHEVKPVPIAAPKTDLPFPFNQRWLIRFWDMAFSKQKPYKPRPDRTAEWNRGAYLVQTLGHCGACHTPRGFAFQVKGYSEDSPTFLKGAVVDNWFAANLRDNYASGLRRWSKDDIVEFLQTGHGAQSAAFGSMTLVIENS
ncbi:MAG TPA: cytochrome c, partial [Methylophilaceae bacterium]|nr:cytochrome c [Methylophilaceae bacterium]